MRPVLLVVALVACTPDEARDVGPGGGTASGSPTGGARAGDLGEVASLWEAPIDDAPATFVGLGVFARDFDGMAAPVPCAMHGALCAAVLPAAEGEVVDWSDSTFTSDVSRIVWVGDAIHVGGASLPYAVDPATGLAGYVGNLDPSADPLDVELGGTWGSFWGEALVPAAAPLELLDPVPGGYLEVTDAAALAWIAGAGTRMYLEWRTDAVHRIWRLADTGNATIPLADLEPLPDDVMAEATLYRVVDGTEADVAGNTLRTATWSAASFVAGRTPRTTCRSIHDADPAAPSGVYAVRPDPVAAADDVWCDMDTDGGGWTLVASSLGIPIDDAAAAWSAELATLDPALPYPGVWTGMRAVVTATSDVRFTCRKDATVPGFDVDLSFYDVGWYPEWTTGSDADSCFNEGDGAGADPPPERRNNLTGEVLAAGDAWSAGFLEGEDTCDDREDFTVDFDDRGIDGNQSDGTDWGEDDGWAKCGVNGIGAEGAWYLFVRER